MPSIKNETQGANYIKAQKLIEPLKLNAIVDRISEFKNRVMNQKFEDFEHSKEMQELLAILEDYQVLNFIAKQIGKMQESANDDLKELWKAINLEQANGLKISYVSESEMIDNDKGKFLVKQLSNENFMVIQLLKSAFESIFKNVDQKSYKIFAIDPKEYIKMKKGYSKFGDTKETNVVFTKPEKK